MLKNKTLVSVLVPCFRSEKYLGDTISEIIKAFSDAGSAYDYRIILVNDASPDGTGDVIRSLCENDSGIIGIDLKENMGQNKALIMGYRFVRGEYLICMDDDGQHPPEAIFQFIRKIDEGYDVVFAQYPELKEPFLRRMASGITDLLLSAMPVKPRRVRDTSFLAMNLRSIEILQQIDEYRPLLWQTLAPYSVRIGTVNVEHCERKHGKSTYSLKKLIELWFAEVFSQKIKVEKENCTVIHADDQCVIS